MPLDENFKLDTGTEWPTVASGMYVAEIIDVEDKGEVEGKWGAKHMLAFRFKVLADKEIDLVKWVANKWSPPGNYKPSNLFLLTEAALGSRPSGPVHPNELIGKKLMLSVKLLIGDDGVKRNQITDFSMIEQDSPEKIEETKKEIKEKLKGGVPEEEKNFEQDMEESLAEE